MRYAIPVLLALGLCLGASQAQARARSCSNFAVIKSYDAAKNVVEVEPERGRLNKFFPRPEGSPADSTKAPAPCKGKISKLTEHEVTTTGGKLSITQVRSNFEGKMLNDVSDKEWLAKKLQELIKNKTEVVIVIRAEKRAKMGELTTIYLPITDEELAEIERIEKQAEDV